MKSTLASNKTFRILSCFGILLILLGHLNCNILEFGGLFPYYSYHVLIFVFISGYFYKVQYEEHIGEYFIKKCKKLLLPYLIFNILAGVLSVLLSRNGFGFGGEINLKNLLIEPFVGGHQYMIIAPGWFIPALFVLEMCNVAGRKIIKCIYSNVCRNINAEYLIMILYFIMGALAVYLAKRGSVYDYYKIPGRIMFMAPVFQMGRMYKEHLEKRDRINTVVYLSVLLLVNYILISTQGGLAFSTVWVTGFKNSVWVPFLTIITGIALWLRISKLVVKALAYNKKGQVTDINPSRVKKRIYDFLEYMGSHTLYICMLHLSAFLLVNMVLCRIAGGNWWSSRGFAAFDAELFKNDVYYAYDGFGRWFKLVYVMAGIGLPLLCAYLFEKSCKFIKKYITEVQNVDCR